MWLLTILMITADGAVTQTAVGLMVNEPICDIAGTGFQSVLQDEDPTLLVAWKCEYKGEEA